MTDETPKTETAHERKARLAKERLAAFYADHRPPSGYQSRVVRNEIVIEPVPRKKGGDA